MTVGLSSLRYSGRVGLRRVIWGLPGLSIGQVLLSSDYGPFISSYRSSYLSLVPFEAHWGGCVLGFMQGIAGYLVAPWASPTSSQPLCILALMRVSCLIVVWKAWWKCLKRVHIIPQVSGWSSKFPVQYISQEGLTHWQVFVLYIYIALMALAIEGLPINWATPCKSLTWKIVSKSMASWVSPKENQGQGFHFCDQNFPGTPQSRDRTLRYFFL